jgi:long-chain acyl-CoA synthetase
VSSNVASFLHHWAVEDPNRTGIVDAGRGELAVSYAELDTSACRVAAALTERGVGPGDRVAIYTENGLGFVAAWFGALYAGCATLPVPIQSTSTEIAFRLDHARCRALVTDASREAVAGEALDRSSGGALVLHLEEALKHDAPATAPASLAPEADAMLLYTSGTTGAAKCARITHGALHAHTHALGQQTLRLEKHDRILGTLPLTHSYGIRTTLLIPFLAGASTVFLPKFSPTRTLELCHAYEVTWLPGVPTMFIAWAHAEDAPTPRHLRWCMSAGAPLMEDVRKNAEARLGAPVRQAYGLTEASLSTVNAPPDEAVPGSSGRPLPGVEVEVVSESGGRVPTGTHGEVRLRGAHVMAGYLDDPLATSHVLRDGWLHTGDIGFLDDAGRLTIVDRTKDLILRGGASIYPSEVEHVLLDHPAVRDAAVVGRPHDYYGEEVVAVVVPKATVSKEALDDWVRAQLAAYKVPTAYAMVDALPSGHSGKTLKRHLRNMLASGAIVASPLSTDGSAQ